VPASCDPEDDPDEDEGVEPEEEREPDVPEPAGCEPDVPDPEE
jgi:hypothetical protein